MSLGRSDEWGQFEGADNLELPPEHKKRQERAVAALETAIADIAAAQGGAATCDALLVVLIGMMIREHGYAEASASLNRLSGAVYYLGEHIATAAGRA
jgi:hypothetical protein